MFPSTSNSIYQYAHLPRDQVVELRSRDVADVIEDIALP